MTFKGREKIIGQIKKDLLNTKSKAYEIQKSLSNKPELISAWKVGGTTKSTQKIFKTESSYLGPINKKNFFFEEEEIYFPNSSINPYGELEIAFRLSKDIESINLKSSSFKSLDFFDSIAPAIEIPYSSMNFPESGLHLLIADCCASGFLILGLEEKLSEEILKKSLKVLINEIPSEVGDSKNFVLPIEKVLLDILIEAKKYNLNLKKGHWISSGGLSKLIELPINQYFMLSSNFSKSKKIFINTNEK